MNRNLKIYCTSYRFINSNEDTQGNFFQVVQRFANTLTKTCLKCVSLQLYESGDTGNLYILFEVWKPSSSIERQLFFNSFNKAVKDFVDPNIQPVEYILAQNTIINQPYNPSSISYFPFNAVECSVLNLEGIDNKTYLPAEDIWTNGLKKFTRAAQSKQVWFNPINPYEVAITIIWQTYVLWKNFPLPMITRLDNETLNSILPATYVDDVYVCFLIKNREGS